MRRFLEPCVQIARFLPDAGPRVLLCRVPLRRIGGHRLGFGGNVRQRFVPHTNHLRGVARALLGIGGDGRHRIALIHDLGARFLPCQHGSHARRFLGGRKIDRHDFRVRVR